MSEIQATKTCRICKTSKSLDEFPVRKTAKDGRRSECKLCQSRWFAEYYRTPRGNDRVRAAYIKQRSTPEGLAKLKEYQTKNRKKITAQKLARRRTPEGRQKAKISARKYYASEAGRSKSNAYSKRPDVRKKINDRLKKKYATDREYREKVRSRNLKYPIDPIKKRECSAKTFKKRYATPEGREAILASGKKYRLSEKGKLAARRARLRRRARQAGATIGDLNAIESWELSWKKSPSVACYWCGKKYPGRKCHTDHIVPLSLGGPHHLDNLCAACEKCNHKKKAKRPEIFNAELRQPRLFL